MTRREPHPADPRAAAAALLSFIFPGLGQAYNRQFLLAVVLAFPIILMVGLALAQVVSGQGLLSQLLDPRVLIGLIVLDVTLLGWRLLAILQAHGQRSRLTPRAWPSWVTAFLVLTTVGMHGLSAFYAVKAVDTLNSIALEGSGRLFQEEGNIPVPTNQPKVASGERVTVLFLGVDFAPGREHHLTDTMLVATIDPRSHRGAMISIPRDLYGVPLGDGRRYDAKLNSLMSVAGANATAYPLGGPGSLKAAIGELLGAPIHYFVAIDIQGLRSVIDTIGGVDVEVERAISDPTMRDPATGELGFRLGPGPHHMDGATALAYARSRKGVGDSDFTRAERQQQLLAAVADKLGGGSLLVALPGLLDAVKDNTASDIPSDQLSPIAAAAQDADLGDLEKVVLAPPDYVTPEPFSVAGYILHPNLEAIRALGREVFGREASSSP